MRSSFLYLPVDIDAEQYITFTCNTKVWSYTAINTAAIGP
jgi:hypothetical protein